MNEKNRKFLWTLIQTTGETLLGKLPNHPNHPNGRNPYAHVALSVKQKFGYTYRNLPDEDLDKIIRFIKSIKN